MKVLDFLSIVNTKLNAGELKTSQNAEENELSIFDFMPAGTVYGANPKKKKLARAMIALPMCVCGESISDLFEWDIKIVAVKKKVVSDIIDSINEDVN